MDFHNQEKRSGCSSVESFKNSYSCIGLTGDMYYGTATDKTKIKKPLT